MPRYFFHVDDGSCLPDSEGAEFTGLVQAREQAAVPAGGVLQEGAAHFWDGQPWSVRVADERGETLFTLKLTASSAPPAGAAGPKPLG